LDNVVNVVDDDVTVLGGGTEEFSISEVETNVINGSNEEAHPTGGTLDESVHEFQGCG